MAVHGDRRAYADDDLVRIERLPSGTEQLEEQAINAVIRAHADRAFHGAEAERTQMIDRFACVFHLDHLLALTPEDRPALLKRRAATLASALKKIDSHRPAARALAAQAVAAPATVPDLPALVAALRDDPRSRYDRVFGALLLRTGNARDAAIVLRAAIRHRPPDAPPVEELLLALACIKQNSHDEARQHLRTAVAWRDQTAQPMRAASIVALRPAGPLAALAALAHTPPDPRLNPLDPFTGHELVTLRAEVEKALPR